MPSEMDILTEQLDFMVASTEALARAMKIWCEGSGDQEKIREEANKVISLEKKGDRSHEKFIEYLFKGGAVHFSKADKLVLSDKIDKILDIEELVARYLIIKPKALVVEKICASDIKKLSELVVECVKVLKECVLLVNKDLDEARESSRKVEDIRRDVRDLEWKILEDLLNSKTLDAQMLLTKEVIVLYGIVADKAEALADYVDTLAVKYRTLR